MRPVVSTSLQLERPFMEVMNFLNEAAARHPNAISFAAGQPPHKFVSAEQCGNWIGGFVRNRAQALGCDEGRIWQMLGQYGATNGMISDLIARHLLADDGLQVDPESLMITNGMQEATLVLLLGLFGGQGEAVLCDDPAYVGLIGAAALARVPVRSLTGEGSILARAERALADLSADGIKARALYVVPDFSNPVGTTLSLSERHDLLDLAHRADIVIIEDTAYRAFRYDGEDLPTLKALDRNGVVVQVGSFSKLFMPGPRIGYLYAEQEVRDNRGGRRSLAQELSKVKSFVSVMTSPVAQAMIGGFLWEQGFSVRAWNAPRVEFCRVNRDAMLSSLATQAERCPEVLGWSRPAGGYFITVDLATEFTANDVLRCVDSHGVIVCPMRFFSSHPAYARSVRLSFSNVSVEQIELGMERFLNYVRTSNGASKRSSARSQLQSVTED